MNRTDGTTTVGARRRSVIVVLSFGMIVATAGVPVRGQINPPVGLLTCFAHSTPAAAPAEGIGELLGDIVAACTTTSPPPALPGQQFLSFTATEVDITLSPPGGTPGPFGLKFVTVPVLAQGTGSFMIPGGRTPTCVTWSGVPLIVESPLSFKLKDGQASVRTIRTTNVRANAQAIDQLNTSPPVPFTGFQLQIGTGCEPGALRIRPVILDTTGASRELVPRWSYFVLPAPSPASTPPPPRPGAPAGPEREPKGGRD